MSFSAGRVDLPLAALPREYDGRSINNKYYILQPRSARSKVRGHLQVYHAYVKENSEDTASIAPERQDSLPQPGETLRLLLMKTEMILILVYFYQSKCVNRGYLDKARKYF